MASFLLPSYPFLTLQQKELVHAYKSYYYPAFCKALKCLPIPLKLSLRTCKFEFKSPTSLTRVSWPSFLSPFLPLLTCPSLLLSLLGLFTLHTYLRAFDCVVLLPQKPFPTLFIFIDLLKLGGIYFSNIVLSVPGKKALSLAHNSV